MPRTPEQEARAKIDAQLADCGWIVQDSRKADFSRGGLGKAHQLFGRELPRLFDELNEALAA